MLARVYAKKKKRPLLLTAGPDGDSGGGGDYSGGMPRPPTMQQQQQGQRGSRTSRTSRASRAFAGGKDGERKTTGLVKRVFGGGKKERQNDYDAVKYNGGGVMYNEDDECEFDGEEEELESEEEPQMLRTRRRFVRSGLTSYEQWISKNAMGRRFSRRSGSEQTSSPLTDPTTGRKTVPGPVSPVYDESSPVNRDERGNSGDAKMNNMSSLSSALQEVIHSRPTALKSIVDPTGPGRVHKSFVVEQNADGDYFVASRRVPDAPVRQTKDDSFIETSTTTDAEFQIHQAAANPGRRSDMDFLYRNKWGSSNALSAASSASSGSGNGSSTAALLSMGKAGIRRRMSGADRGMDTISDTPIATAGPPGRRSSNAGKARDSAYSGQTVMNQMAMRYMDHMRQRSTSQASDGGFPSILRGRKESTAMLQAGSSFEDIDAVPLSMDDLVERKPSIDSGPMTMDEFMFDAAPPLPAPRKNSGGKSATRAKRATTIEVEEEDEVETMFTTSFRNLKDVDALKRSRSMEEDEKVTTTTEETETEEEFTDFTEERTTEDYGSSYENNFESNYGSSYEEDTSARSSNISEFLGGFKSRNSMNRNSLAGRNSAGRNSLRKDDFVSRAARSLRNSRKVAQESVKVSSELSRKLREARARVPMDLRGDPPTSQKKRKFLGRDGKRVRFDNNNYIREFEVIEPEPSDDDNEVQRWQQRDSEMDDDDDDDEEYEENSTDDDSWDFGVPIPGAVLKAAMNDATAFYSNMPPTNGMQYGAPTRMSNGGARTMEDDKRVSVVSRKSNGNQFEILL